MVFESFSKFNRLFNNLENLVQKKYPHEYDAFKFYHMDLIFKLQYLEIISLRYEDDKNNWIEINKKLNRYLETYKSLSQKLLEEESRNIAKQVILYSTLLELDVDSFFIFARILLDRIPYLLRPLYKGIVTNQEIAIRDMREHLDWFKNNPKAVLDLTFYNKMISFREWFYEKLREPRNEYIVHPEWNHIKSSINSEGKIEKIRYKLHSLGERKIWSRMESTELPEINMILGKIIEFLEFLNEYFSRKLSSFNKEKQLSV